MHERSDADDGSKITKHVIPVYTAGVFKAHVHFHINETAATVAFHYVNAYVTTNKIDESVVSVLATEVLKVYAEHVGGQTNLQNVSRFAIQEYSFSDTPAPVERVKSNTHMHAYII